MENLQYWKKLETLFVVNKIYYYLHDFLGLWLEIISQFGIWNLSTLHERNKTVTRNWGNQDTIARTHYSPNCHSFLLKTPFPSENVFYWSKWECEWMKLKASLQCWLWQEWWWRLFVQFCLFLEWACSVILFVSFVSLFGLFVLELVCSVCLFLELVF